MLDMPNRKVGVYRCNRCGLLQRFLMPSEKDCPTGKRYGEYTAGSDTANPRALRRLALLERRYGLGPLLDVGAGTGSFVKAARERGWNAVGVEKPGSATRNEWIYPLDIVRQDIPGFPPGTFHVVHLHHVLEHVDDIAAFLAGCLRQLAVDGILVAEVPNEVRSLSMAMKRLLRRPYESRTAFLEHRYFFTRRTLKRILAGAGLRILRWRTPFTCHATSIPHQAFDAMQAMAGMGNTLEAYCRKF